MASAIAERRSSVSSVGAHSIDSTPRLSIDKRHSTDRRLSTDSSIRTPLPNLPGITSLPGLSSNSPLAAGAAIPPPIPPKDRLPPPMTPTRKPVQRQKSPLSSEAFSSATAASPASTMPGAYPITPSPGQPAGISTGQFNARAYASNSPPISTTSPQTNRSPGKRASNFRNFLPFKALRRSYGNTSPDPSPKSSAGRPSSSLSFRPTTPGADSMVSGDAKHRLRHKISGTFWKRKSSLGIMGFGSGGTDEQIVATSTNGSGSPQTRSPTSPRTNGASTDLTNDESIVHEDDGEYHTHRQAADRPSTPLAGDGSSILPKKRKSGTFWRRKSSLALDSAADTERSDWGNGGRETSVGLNGKGHEQDLIGGRPYESLSDDTRAPSTMEVPIVLRKSQTPPPQLPEFVGAGGGLGGEDLFKDIF